MERPQTIFTEPVVEVPELCAIEVLLATTPNLILASGALDMAAQVSFCLAIVCLISVAARGSLGRSTRPAVLSMTIASGPCAGLLFYIFFMLFCLGPDSFGDY